MDTPHRSLVERAIEGDQAAAGELLERHLPHLLAYVRLHAGTALSLRESSMDLVQSTCREVLADLPRIEKRDEANFKHWLFQAAERKLIDRARFHRREKRDRGREVALEGSASSAEERCLSVAYATVSTPSREAEARESIERLEGAVRKLPPSYREVILLARVVGLPRGEIAERLGRTEESVRVLLHRALAKLTLLLRSDTD